MKILNAFILGIILILSIGCKRNKDDGFLVNGTIDGYTGDYIYLRYGDIIDSSLVQNDSFIFKGKVSYPTKGILYPAPPSSNEQMTIGLFMLETGVINISAKYSIRNLIMGTVKFLDIDSINGSKSQELRNRFEVKMNKTVHNEQNDSIKKIFLYNNLYKFISENPKSEMSGEYLADLNRSNNYLSGKQIKNLFKLIDTGYQEKRDIESIRKTIFKREMFHIGNIPPDVILPDQEGKMINRSSLKGKVVLLEFWASWCVPCRQANPDLLSIYNKSKKRGFEIFGISIDKDANKWRDAIKKDNISWLHVIDTLRTTEKTYNLNSIPFNLLLNREGKIIAQNIEPNELMEILNKEL
jgi:peroxiredoxin